MWQCGAGGDRPPSGGSLPKVAVGEAMSYDMASTTWLHETNTSGKGGGGGGGLVSGRRVALPRQK